MYEAVLTTIMRRAPLALLAVALLSAGVPEVWAYTSAVVRSNNAGTIKVVAAQPAGGTQPFVYCSAPNVTVAAGSTGTIPVTCGNGLDHSVTLSITYTPPSDALVPPTYTPVSPLSLTVPANSQATASITVTTTALTTKRTYSITYAASTSGSPAVAVSGIGFANTLTVS